MKNKFVIVSVLAGAVIASVAITGNVFAQGDKEEVVSQQKSWQKREGPMRELDQRLNLTDEQKKLLKENRESRKEDIKENNLKLKAAKDAIKEELKKKDLDMAAVNKLHAQVKDLQMKMEDYRLEGILAVRKILTPEQYAKFIEFTVERRGGKHKSGPGSKGQESTEPAM